MRNVVQMAREFDEIAMRPGINGYKQVAEQFGVTKATVSHYLSILRRLPQEFVEWLGNCDDPAVLTYFSERRLRSITRLPKSEQLRWLRATAGQLLGEASAVVKLLERLDGAVGESASLGKENSGWRNTMASG